MRKTLFFFLVFLFLLPAFSGLAFAEESETKIDDRKYWITPKGYADKINAEMEYRQSRPKDSPLNQYIYNPAPLKTPNDDPYANDSRNRKNVLP
jgi:hypothetical protein